MGMASRWMPRPEEPTAEAPPLRFGGPLLMQLVRYLPLLMRLLAHLPGFTAGFILTCLFFAVVGRDTLRNEYAPVAGFHVVALMLLRELVAPWREGKKKAAFVRQRVASLRSFADDVQLQWRDVLD
ncbi:hypothetical protein TcYC6_0034650 [Trypanosoma cruzi]|nr:hypothetical protein TcYC6_0034650 [Trypanosoma cruzi]RNF22081.1 hypothetical protein TcG_02532 [Trypanosoma cruzi]